MNQPDDQHDPLVDALRNLVAQNDPVPLLVTQAAKAALGWRRVDAELAELLADSAVETTSLATTRAHEATLRTVTFSAGSLTIDLEIQDESTGHTAVGKLSPPGRARIEVQNADRPAPASTTRIETDEQGRFRTELPATSLIRLRVAIADPDRPSWIETGWIPL